jgi:D-alanyl-D-alanine carboxypeptidase (penicillin-binding protein 5/6)
MRLALKCKKRLSTCMIKTTVMKGIAIFLKLLAVLAVGVVINGFISFLTPLPPVQIERNSLNLPVTQPVQLPWPAEGQAAVGAIGYGVLATKGPEKAAPTASVAKIITAMMILREKPLKLGEQGPIITISGQDVSIYNSFISQNGSVAAVQSGEQISEYQALETMLLPSANNMAYSLAWWAFGSIDHFNQAANAYLKDLHINNTQITDPSGFSPTTTSTAADLVLIAAHAMQNPVLAKIVSQTETTVPVAGLIHNTNFLLGDNGINGIKTGHTDEAGGCYLFSSSQIIAGHKLTIIGAVVGESSIDAALASASKLNTATATEFSEVKIASSSTPVGSYKTAWGKSVPIVPKADLNMLIWKNSLIITDPHINQVKAPLNEEMIVGSLSAFADNQVVKVPLQTASDLPTPSLFWRIFH